MVRPCRLLLWQLLLRWCHMATGEDRGVGGAGVVLFFRAAAAVFPHTSWKVFMASPTENVLYFLLLHHHHH